MASIAMDKSGNIGVGYSVASLATYPSIRYTGWEVGNTLGALNRTSEAAHQLMLDWGKLHAVRSVLALGASVVFLSSVIWR